MIDTVEQREAVRVALFCLECVDGLELTIDQSLVATSEVDEGVGDATLESRDAFANAGSTVTHCTQPGSNARELSVLKGDAWSVVLQVGDWLTARECCAQARKILIGDGERFITKRIER